MRIPRTVLTGVIAVASIGIVAPVFAGKSDAPGQKYPTSQNTVHDCGDDRTITFAGPATLWPPNHKYFEAVITATGDGNDEVAIDSTGTHDEYTDAEGTEMGGAGNTADDVSPPNAADAGHGNVASVTQSIRSERSGQGDGRVYSFDVIATFDDEPCTVTFTSTVPHDMRPSNRT